MKGAAAIVLGIVAAFLFIAAFTAQGTPSAPAGHVSATLNPSQAQALQVTLTGQVYSVQAPNSIDLLGGRFIYSVTEQAAGSTATVLVQAQTTGWNVGPSSGGLFTVFTTVSFNTVALCTGTNCAGVVEYLNVSALSIVSTYWGVLSSPTAKLTFVSTSTSNTVGTVQAPHLEAFLQQLLGPILLAVAFAFFAAGITFNVKPAYIVGAVLVIADVVIVIILTIW